MLAVVIGGRPRHCRMGLLDFDVSKQKRFVIGGKDYVLDLPESGDDPLADLSLSAAIAMLTDGLARLPELAAKAPEPATMAFRLLERQALSIDLEFEEDQDFRQPWVAPLLPGSRNRWSTRGPLPPSNNALQHSPELMDSKMDLKVLAAAGFRQNSSERKKGLSPLFQ